MIYFAFFTRQHGLKLIQAMSRPGADSQWDRNAGGHLAPEWVASYPAALHSSMKELARIGWHGTLKDFHVMLAEAAK